MLVQLGRASDAHHLADVLKKYDELNHSLFLGTTRRADYNHIVERLGEAEARVVLKPWMHRLPDTTFRYNLMAKLAQAIVHSPDLVILDEPTNGLDPVARSRMLNLVREMKEEHGMSVLLCSHLLRDVEEVCDEVIILNEGRIVHHADLEAERRANRRFVELEVTGDDGGLGAALQTHGIESVREGGGRWRIVLPTDVDVDVIWQLVNQEDLLVHHLSQRRDSLEEIFLKAVGHIGSSPPDGTVAAEEAVANDHL